MSTEAGRRFANDEALVKWLTSTLRGRAVLRDAIAAKQSTDIVAEYVEREIETLPSERLPTRPTHVVVEVAGDGYTKVYGERHVRVKIVQRPLAHKSVRDRVSIAVDDWIDASLPRPFREVYYPSAVRGAELCKPIMLRDLIDQEAQTQITLAAVRAFEEIGREKREEQDREAKTAG